MKKIWKVLLVVALIAGASIFAYENKETREQVVSLWLKATSQAKADVVSPARDESPEDKGPWDGLVAMTKEEERTIGLATTKVLPQTKPSQLRLSGTTAYDPATLTVVRTQFDSRVDKVHVDIGAKVKRGDPLVDLFSNPLAEAKSAYETAFTQWTRDKKMLERRGPLAQANMIEKNKLVELENDESKSRQTMKLAKDKLLVYGLTDPEIENAKKEDGTLKAKMTIRSQVDGYVIERKVVKGNFYDSKDDLMVIAPLDHYWVRGSVNEADANQVRIGQDAEVFFTYSDEHLPAKVEYIDNAIDPETRAAKLRMTIPNDRSMVRSGAFVRVYLNIPPVPGRTVIPRVSMISVDRDNYVFVKKAGSKDKDRFERRSVRPSQENNDDVLIAEPTKDHLGLKEGEEIVTKGSLMLEQLYEDLSTRDTGSPP